MSYVRGRTFRDCLNRRYKESRPGYVVHTEELGRRGCNEYEIAAYPNDLFPVGPGELIIEEEPD